MSIEKIVNKFKDDYTSVDNNISNYMKHEKNIMDTYNRTYDMIIAINDNALYAVKRAEDVAKYMINDAYKGAVESMYKNNSR